MSYNRIILLGNVGKDPEVREFENGKLASFTLATSEKGYTNKNGVQVPESTQWHNCVCFGKTADFVANYIRKGHKLLVEGKVRYRSYEQNGATKWITEIVVDHIDNATPKSDNQGYQQQGGYQQPPMPQAQPQGFAPAPPPSANDIPGYGQQDDRLPF